MTDAILWDYAERYPNQPGFRRARTSRAAAEAMKERAPTLRDRVLALLKVEDLTADEAAEKLAKTVLSIRPRVAELKAKGLIFDSGFVRRNNSGVNAIVWRVF